MNTCLEHARNTDSVLLENSKRKLILDKKNIIKQPDALDLQHVYVYPNNKFSHAHGSMNIPINAANLRVNRNYDISHHASGSATSMLLIMVFILVMYIIYMIFQSYLIQRKSTNSLKCLGFFSSLYWYTHNFIFTLFHRLFTVKKPLSFKSHHV